MGKLTKYILLVVVCVVIPSALVWNFLPSMLGDYPKVYNIVHRVTAIYMTIVTTWLLISFANSFRALGEQHKLPHQQYLNSFISVLKIVLIFIAVIVVIAIVLDKDPSTLIAGLGAASAILMLAFQDTIKGLVAGIRLASNDMVHVGDWVTVSSAGANGKVEDITLTTVKIRNFDNTISTVSPQALVDGTFQNWQGMIENEGRKQVRRVFYDFQSLKVDDDGVANITKFRHHIEKWLKENPRVVDGKDPLVKQSDTQQPSGCCVEFIFWLKAQDAITFEHDTSDIMEYVYAKSGDFGLRIYQQVIEK